MAAREQSLPRRRQSAHPVGETSSHRVFDDTHAAQARKILGRLRDVGGVGERERERACDGGMVDGASMGLRLSMDLQVRGLWRGEQQHGIPDRHGS